MLRIPFVNSQNNGTKNYVVKEGNVMLPDVFR